MRAILAAVLALGLAGCSQYGLSPEEAERRKLFNKHCVRSPKTGTVFGDPLICAGEGRAGVENRRLLRQLAERCADHGGFERSNREMTAAYCADGTAIPLERVDEGEARRERGSTLGSDGVIVEFP